MIATVDLKSYLRVATSTTKVEDQEKMLQQPVVKATAASLHKAVSEHGFCYLVNHGVPECALDRLQASAKGFFGLPDDVKQKFHIAKNINGWTAMGRESTNPDERGGDPKEAFDYCPAEQGLWPTEEAPEMKADFKTLFHHLHQLSNSVLDLLGLALGFKDPLFLRKCHGGIGQAGNHTILRSLYYPMAAAEAGHIVCGEHSDYGSITVLFQDDVGGLQILGKDGQYHDVPPVKGAAVVNVGDLMQRWTADRYPATKHRVVVPLQQTPMSGRDRQSVAFFVHPDDQTIVSCLDGSDTYPPVSDYDYLMQRYQATYEDLGRY